jgi:hypothetical protein
MLIKLTTGEGSAQKTCYPIRIQEADGVGRSVVFAKMTLPSKVTQMGGKFFGGRGGRGPFKIFLTLPGHIFKYH